MHLTFRDRANEAGDLVGKAPIRAFLYGPDDTIVAGSYERTDNSAVWLLPRDIERPDLWIVEALHEWHEDYPSRFPSVPDWPQSPEWRTAAERAIHAERDRRRDEIMAAIDAYQAEDAVLQEQAEQAAYGGDQYERALLAADGETLRAWGGRVLNVTASGATLKEARDRAYQAVDRIDWTEGFCRRDIGWRALSSN